MKGQRDIQYNYKTAILKLPLWIGAMSVEPLTTDTVGEEISCGKKIGEIYIDNIWNYNSSIFRNFISPHSLDY